MSVAEAENLPEKEPTESPPEKEPSAQSPGRTALLRGRVEIDLETRLRHRESGEALAFAAEDRGDKGRPMFALVCKHGVPYRQKPLSELKGKLQKNLLSVVTDGLIPVPGTDDLRLVVVLERPEGMNLAEALADRGKPFDERTVMQDYLPQLLSALRELEAIGVAHRGIRPDNVYFTDVKGETLALGDFITVPPGSQQPSVFEPLESAQAMPDGRGNGTMLHDTFALGVLLLTLLTGSVPGEGKDPDTLMDERLTKSSYTALAGNYNVSATIGDLLLGLMCDDVSERWGLDEIDAWMRGQRLSPRRSVPAKRGIRVFPFMGKDHTYDLELAAALFRHPDEAEKAIRDEGFADWLRTGLQAPRLAENCIELIAVSPKPSKAQPIVHSRISSLTIGTLLLDPKGPLRRKGISIAIDGFGPVLAAAFTNKDKELKTAVMSLLASEAPKEWIRLRREANSNLSVSTGIFSRLLEHGADTALGSGPERCLYELNAALPCQSPAIAKYWVSEMGRLLTALDDAAANADKNTDLLDRHLAAFIGTYSPEGDKMLKRFKRQTGGDRVMLALRLFAMLQVRFNAHNLTNLTRWLGSRLDPLVESFHSRTRREYLKERIGKAQANGDITLLLDLVNSATEDTADGAQFEAAEYRYAANENEIEELAHGSAKVEAMGRALGARAARALAFVLLLLSLLLVIIGVKP